MSEQKQRLYGGERSYLLDHRYGISAAQFEWLKLRQDGRCAICREAPAVHVDHDHRTKQVRGLLCFNCNRGLGYLDDDLVTLCRAADYLKSHGSA
jgi:Recombination endonuclease VII